MQRVKDCPVCGKSDCVLFASWRGYCFRFGVTFVKAAGEWRWSKDGKVSDARRASKSEDLFSGESVPYDVSLDERFGKK
jgi:hypothetical protein